jgi:hypothetical protein
MTAVGDVVKLVYEETGKPPQNCGETVVENLSALESWVADQCEVFDTVVFTDGVRAVRHATFVTVRA